MKKKIFLNSKLSELFVYIILLAGILFTIYILIRDLVIGENPTIIYAYFLLPLFVIGGLLFIFIFYIWVLQFVVIDEEKIVLRTIFSKIEETNWEDIKEIKIRLKKSKYSEKSFVFVSKKQKSDTEDEQDMVDEQKDDFNIYLIYSKKREQFLRMLKPDIKFNG